MLSHELKTPLVPIKGYTEMLLKPRLIGELNNNQIKAIQSIYRNTENLEIMIQNILFIYSLETKKTTITKSHIKVKEILDNVINDLKPTFEQKNISIVSKINTKNSNTIYCDVKRIEQVFSNLIINSIDFVPKNIGKITIIIEEKENQFLEKKSYNLNDNQKNSQFYWEFTVRDNGIGIPIDKVNLLFTKFYRINTSVNRKYGGTGLGLAICKDIVEAHGGRIWLDKNYTKGTSIKFTIP